MGVVAVVVSIRKLQPNIFREVVPFWYQITQVVLENRSLNRCSSGTSKYDQEGDYHLQSIDQNTVTVCLTALYN